MVTPHTKHCKYNCNDSFDLVKQSELNKLYNKLSNLEKTSFIYDNVKKGINLKNKKDKYEYKLIGETVCRNFFLNTIGLKSFSKIREVMKKS